MNKVVAYLFKNMGIIIGIMEALLKAAAGIVSLTPTKFDDGLVKKVDDFFSVVKGYLYNISDKFDVSG